MVVTKRRTAGKRSKKKTSMCSFRVEPHLKEKLHTIARQQARSLSSLIEQVLQDFVELQQAELPRDAIEKDRRQHPRKEILLPARWRLRKGKDTLEHDVLIKNISAGGAYTEYLNGQIYKFFEKNHKTSLKLTVRLPGLRESVALECEAVRFHLTRDCLGVGLRYIELADQKTVAALKNFLT
jgi:hypothetical protein